MRTFLLSFIFLLGSSTAPAQTRGVNRFEDLRSRSIQLAEAIIQGIGKPSDYRNYSPPWQAGHQIVRSFHLRNIETIAAFGFANSFQTGNTTGTFSIDRRLVGEAMLADVKGFEWTPLERGDGVKIKSTSLSFHPTEIRPKSAFAMSGGIENYEGFRVQYGDAHAVFRQSTWRRTGITSKDSLDKIIDLIYSGLSKKEIETPMVNEWFRDSIPEASSRTAYAEALIWGPLDLRDVEALYVREHAYKILKDVLEPICEHYGIKLFTYKDRSFQDTYQLTSIKQVRLSKKKRPLEIQFTDSAQIIKVLEKEKDRSVRRLLIDRLAFLDESAGLSYLRQQATQLERKDKSLKRIDIGNIENLVGDEVPSDQDLAQEYVWLRLALNRKQHLDKLLKAYSLDKIKAGKISCRQLLL